MKYTQNYNLKKPEGTDTVNIDDLNYNADIIDTQLKTNADAISQHINAAAPHSGHALLGTSNQEINFFKALNQQIDTRSIALVYDANGRLTTVVKKDGETIIKTVSLSYDTDSKLTQVQEVVGGKTITITLHYDANGILTAVTRSVN